MKTVCNMCGQISHTEKLWFVLKCCLEVSIKKNVDTHVCTL